jgi:Xaa-Pro aminopeptidase
MVPSNKPVVSHAKAYLKARQKNVRTGLKELKLDAMLITHAPDLAYLSDFTGDDSVGLLTAKDFILVTDGRFKEQAQLEAPWLKLVVREGRMPPELARAVIAAGPRRIGFEANFTTVGQIDALKRALVEEGNSQVELVPLENVMTNIRRIKDDREIELTRKSIEIAQEAFEAIFPLIKVGQSEGYIAGSLIFEMKSRGASDGSFPAIVAAGANSSLPHYRTGDREVLITANRPFLIDWGALYRGYCSDLTRTLMIGQVSPRLKRIYQVVLEAQQEAIAFLRPGVSNVQADRVARAVIDKAGFGEFFGHGLGHGIGRAIHELPQLGKHAKEEELQPGMIVTVEPGIYLPGEGGVRIEDDVLITHSGCEVLTTLDNSFEGCHLE